MKYWIIFICLFATSCNAQPNSNTTKNTDQSIKGNIRSVVSEMDASILGFLKGLKTGQSSFYSGHGMTGKVTKYYKGTSEASCFYAEVYFTEEELREQSELQGGYTLSYQGDIDNLIRRISKIKY